MSDALKELVNTYRHFKKHAKSYNNQLNYGKT